MLLIWELTLPWEERIEVAHQSKMNCYEALAFEVLKVFFCEVLAFEVCCRGFVAELVR